MNTRHLTSTKAYIILALYLLVPLGLWLLTTGGRPSPLDNKLSQYVSSGSIVEVIVLLNLVGYFGRWHETGIRNLNHWRDLRLLWLPALFITIFLVIGQGLQPAGKVPIPLLVNMLFVGISEELMFRGILFDGIATASTTLHAVWMTALLFGLAHLLNGLMTGDFTGALIQTISAILAGVCYGALRLRFGTIVPLMFVHALWDFSLLFIAQGVSAMSPSLGHASVAVPSFGAQLLFTLGLRLPFFFYGLWLLRGYRLQLATAQ